jgi:membrane peptidoglycan carboxypeptidase
VLYRHERRVVRRLMRPDVAAEVRRMMVGVVEGGTGKEAALENFTLAGKSGTARRGASRRGYTSGSYTASFIGLFPAATPQYVILVKLDNPKASIFGGVEAAPVSKVVLEAAIAARDAALDRRALAESESSGRVVDSAAAQLGAPAATGGATVLDTATDVIALPARFPATRTAAARAVPDVRGLSLREAVGALHRAGFRVQLAGFGAPSGTVPAAGSLARPGTLVRVASTP